MVVAVAPLRLAAVDHPVVKEVEVARDLPDLRVHDDRAVEARHLVGRGSALDRREFVVAGDHVTPPAVLEIPLEGDTEGAVVPEAVQAAVDLTRLKDEAAPLRQRHDPVHPRLLVLLVVHKTLVGGKRPGINSGGIGRQAVPYPDSVPGTISNEAAGGVIELRHNPERVDCGGNCKINLHAEVDEVRAPR